MSKTSESGDSNNPWDDKTSKKFENKQPGEYLDPCQEAASRSLKCLHRNGGDKEMCADYFQHVEFADTNVVNRAYRDCKKKWMDDRREMKLREGKSWFAR